MAARMAIKRLDGASVDAQTTITAPLVIRQSCGCSESDAADRRTMAPSDPKAQSLRESVLRDLVRRELSSARLQRELSRLGEGILGASDYSDLAPLLTDACRLLNVRRFVLATYSGSQRHARVTLESSGGSVVFHPHAEAYGVDQLFPPGFLRSERPAQIAVHALELAGEQLGYLLIDGDVKDDFAYLDLRRSVSSALSRMAASRELRRVYTAEKKRS
jgi:hypothetical protein